MKRLVRRAATSLLTRILLVEGITIVVASLAMPFAARTVLESSVRAIERDTLRQQAELVARHVIPAPGGHWQVALPREEMAIYATGYDGRAFAVIDARGQVLAHSPFFLPDIWPQPPRAWHEQALTSGPLVGLSVPRAFADQNVRIVVTQDQTRPGAVVDDVVRSFLAHYLVWLVGLLLLMPLANITMLWPLLRRMRHTARAATQLAPQDPGARLDAAGLPAEATAMVSAINGLLDRVEAALALQQEFAGNVAHELRTPLATLRLEVGRMAAEPARDEALAQIARMAHVLDQLRDLASLEHDAAPAFERFDLAGLAVAVVADRTPDVLAGGRSIALFGAEETVMTHGNPGLVAMAIANLLDNARLHTPPGTAIEVSVARPAQISIADNGPGVTEEEATRLARRFWRADHRRSDGAGLGLSIVQRIAHVHHGRLLISRAASGGACFTLSLAEYALP
ncbi:MULTISPECIES: HAMP domain-containing sensor histidine kinase [unclassified Novosphingobium]|uniref:sensor histidine kinase n=1 Tax=unclassified Novosphingobium TaxID=2644732 RepID=UPI000D302EAD|nr:MULTISPECIES: ATP-binding protein [unclassified Novosphingobium]PTR07232.1 signal transduction histidine kinase [Novosphingobium sp. GV055]PUB00045.1 signal transduction histidine kinase [Novosphingobium sp. GV061]PUB15015.1 signal transduction histidine kinase [Novosphingobium sp. GV079]PUB39074.1 signal transduction histidine kinase [Novosphingobium sp. GV027]